VSHLISDSHDFPGESDVSHLISDSPGKPGESEIKWDTSASGLY
jgi:hypothetical protein